MPTTNANQHPHRRRAWLAGAVLAACLGGCGDPYAHKLPADGRLGAGEAEQIARALTGPDQERFQRWAHRMLRQEHYGGEPSAGTVQHALRNQTEFELQQQQAQAEAAARQAQAEEQARQQAQAQREQQAALEQLHSSRAAVHARLLQHISARTLHHEFKPVVSAQGEVFAHQWVISVALDNPSAKRLVSASGWLQMADTQGRALGALPLHIDTPVLPGKSLEHTAVIDHQRNHPLHTAMAQADALQVQWVLESVAFADGTVLSASSLPAPPALPGASAAASATPAPP